MNWLPVASRELVLLSRQRRTYLLRVLSGAVVMLISLGMLYAGFGGLLSAASAGRNLFWCLSVLAGGFVLFDGALRTSDCLSQEKREGTLGLLFLTDLKGYDLVAGKLMARVAISGYCLLAALPALGIALFLGGVTGRDYACMVIALLNALFFAASFGMLASALCRQERAALNLGLAGVLGWTILMPAFGWLSTVLGATKPPPWPFLVSPAGAFLDALTSGAAGQSSGFTFTASLGVTQLLAWCFLLAASLILPHRWTDDELATSPRSAQAQLPSLRTSPGRSTFGGRRSRLESNPLLWVGDRGGWQGFGLWPAFLVLIVVWLGAREMNFWSWPTLPVYLFSAFSLHVALTYFVLLRACRSPAQDQREGVLEMLLTAPLGDDIYLRGRMLSLKRQCLWPLLFVLALDFGLFAAGCWETGAWNWEWLSWMAAFGALVGKLFLDLYTLSWVGFWQGLKTRNTSRALRLTVFYAFLLRWILLLGFIAVLGLLSQGRMFQSPIGMVLSVVGYVVLVFASAGHFCGLAMSELRDELRSMAALVPKEQMRESWFSRDLFRFPLSE